MKHKNLEYQSEMNQVVTGQPGITILSAGESSNPGDVYAGVTASEDAVFSCGLTANDKDEIGDSSITNLKVPAGVSFLGRYVNITVTSGVLYCYKG